MTKKHFIAAAELIRNIVDGNWTNEFPDWANTTHCDCTDYERAVMTAEYFIHLASEFNPRFNRDRFLIACGLVAAPPKPKRGKR